MRGDACACARVRVRGVHVVVVVVVAAAVGTTFSRSSQTERKMVSTTVEKTPIKRDPTAYADMIMSHTRIEQRT